MKLIFCFLIFLFAPCLWAQQNPGFDPHYQFKHSQNLVGDKNFYLLTILQQSSSIRPLLQSDSILVQMSRERVGLMQMHISDTCNWPLSLLGGFKYTSADSIKVALSLSRLYDENKMAFDDLIDWQLRPSGYYQLYSGLGNKSLLQSAWARVVVGTNYMIDQFGMGKKLRYPNIDSATYNVNSSQFRGALKEMFAWFSEQKSDGLFFSPALSVALKLMDINGRDEPARNEPLEEGLNKNPFEHLKHMQWDKYQFTAILVLGSGPEINTVAISPIGKMRCDIGAINFKKGLAPFIIVSGGYVAPFRTPYCEAIEMKKYLVEKKGIPEEAIITEPFARHTTTNIRNANRILFRFGLPTAKPVMVVSSKSHIESITDSTGSFDRRNMIELGYMPYRLMKRTGMNEAEYFPEINSLQTDPTDPLDP